MSIRSSLLSPAALVLLGVISVSAGAESPSAHVDGNGNIELPADFRMTMVHLGSWFVPEGPASGFHDVYTEAQSAEHYRSHGSFPDGATLVKELRAHTAANYSTGVGVSSATSSIKQWFVMVKDTNNRYPDNPLWGDGWGWALYKPDAPGVNVASDYRKDCLGCHEPARSTDLVYVRSYPTLRP